MRLLISHGRGAYVYCSLDWRTMCVRFSPHPSFLHPTLHRSQPGFGVLHILKQTQPMCDDACDGWPSREKKSTGRHGAIRLSAAHRLSPVRPRQAWGAYIRQGSSRKAREASCQGAQSRAVGTAISVAAIVSGVLHKRRRRAVTELECTCNYSRLARTTLHYHRTSGLLSLRSGATKTPEFPAGRNLESMTSKASASSTKLLLSCEVGVSLEEEEEEEAVRDAAKAMVKCQPPSQLDAIALSRSSPMHHPLRDEHPWVD